MHVAVRRVAQAFSRTTAGIASHRKRHRSRHRKKNKEHVRQHSGLLCAVKGIVGEDIRRIRKKLNLTQAELASVFGIGKMAFSRYERGESRPPAPLVKLLKLIDRHPNLLGEMRNI